MTTVSVVLLQWLRARRWAGSWAIAVLITVVTLWPYPKARLDAKALASLRIEDRAGRSLYESRSEVGGYGRWVPLSRVSPELVILTLSSEDANFRRHPGVDPTGIGRALWLNASAGRLAFGGSTLTQQLAKVLDGQGRARTLLGKLSETRDALRLELLLSKDAILEQYLNRVYYGRLAYGVEAAAQRFFGKSAQELTLDQAALLAILPRGPSAYDPARFPERAKQRRAHVLRVAAERGWLEPESARRAADAPIVLAPLPTPKARHLLDALPLEAMERGGTLVTTVDLELSERLERRIRLHLADLARSEADQAAIVVLENRTGDVLAMLGSRDYEESSARGAVNAALARRAPGSTLKPFVYALAVERGRNPASPLFDVPTTFRDFQPRNAGFDYRGRVSLREALGSSLNVPAVRLAEEVGFENVVRRLVDLGLETSERALEREGLALALGSAKVRLIDLANAYATLARGGEHRPFRLFSPEGRAQPPVRVIQADAAFLITNVLSDATARRRQFGLETPLELPFPVAVKTGTSKSFCDNWVVGYTPAITVAVWVGNFDGRPMHELLAMQGAAPLFRDAMLLAMDGRAPEAFAKPDGVDSVELCPVSGMARTSSCPHGRHEHVSRRHLPGACTWHAPDGSLRLPAELRALSQDPKAHALADAENPLRIASPAANARFVVDALLPRDRQKLPLRALVGSEGVERVRWQVDGRTVAEVPAPFTATWTIEPGIHRVRALALANGASAEAALAVAEVEVEVHGGTP